MPAAFAALAGLAHHLSGSDGLSFLSGISTVLLSIMDVAR
jgi:hypothetical protein